MIGLFGGTFDPVHKGHLQLAEQAISRLKLDEVQFLPCANPVHRDAPIADAKQRLRMLKLAIADHTRMRVNTLEIDRGGASYMVETLAQMASQQGDSIICLLIGVDAFNGIKNWRSPETVLDLVHLIVCRRPQTSIDRTIFCHHHVDDVSQLEGNKSGCIYELDINENPCSSTEVRRLLGTTESVETCLTKPVIDYIKQNHLYGN